MAEQANIAGNKAPDLAPDDAAGLVRPPGRPKGSRNRATKAIREIAQKYTRRAVLRCWKLAKDAENQDVQLKALQLILAYGHGRPTDRQELSGPEGERLLPTNLAMTDKELARRVALILTQADGTDALAALTEGRDGSTPRRAEADDVAGSSAPRSGTSSAARNNGKTPPGGPLSAGRSPRWGATGTI